ncbi:MgtC/SapB family protein [Serratia marcescens]|uniref:MgtC/SapB family protein n=1 Tax=Serratia marcescens TaxID=615 RepID=UPI000A5EB368|nr:MgtC/SapB family protein [Serratia marcescens]
MIYLNVAPLSWSHILACLLCGSLIGLERQLHGKPVGMRTSTLIMLGSYLFLAMGLHLAAPMADRSRVLGQLVSGIGFLGAGVMMTRDGQVMGVTSAATVWVLAALGAMIGLDMLSQAVMMTLVILGLLTGASWLENSFKALQRGVHRRRDVSPRTVSSHTKPQNDIARRESDLSDNH